MNLVTKTLTTLALACIAWMPAAAAAADVALRLEWTDLAPKRAPAENPFASMSEEDKNDLRLVARSHDSKRMGLTLSEEAQANADKAAARLRERKIDAVQLLTERDKIIAQREMSARSVVPELNGKTVSLAGYMLPLEFKGELVSEFLLVPWVGACIHTPPPPSNQVVYVKPAKPVEAKGRFAPIRITGPMQTQGGQRNLSLVDGAAAVDTSYTMIGADVRPFVKLPEPPSANR